MAGSAICGKRYVVCGSEICESSTLLPQPVVQTALQHHNISSRLPLSHQTDESRAARLGFRNSGGSAKPWMGARKGVCNRGIISIPRNPSSATVL